ncbi:MAG: hypothetical protein M0Q20_04735 [Sulfurimonas sp.]|nr:hypothetical protein [Sulfurimonas sp.]
MFNANKFYEAILYFIEILISRKLYSFELSVVYQQAHTISKQAFYTNTIDKYLQNLETNLKNTQLPEAKAQRRYKNRITKTEFDIIKKLYDLYDVEIVATNDEKPYFYNLLYLIDSTNCIKYIKEEQFKCAETQYNYDNYLSKTQAQKDKAKAFDKQHDINEAQLHKELINTYKDHKIKGSMIIKSLQHPILELFAEDAMYHVLKNNQNFQKQFSKVNFTELELIQGFTHQISWNYTHWKYDEYKEYIKKHNQEAKKYNPNKENHQDYKRPLSLIKKLDIQNQIIEIINAVFHNEPIKQIRSRKEKPNVLKVYDEIHIPTTKSVHSLEQAFYSLVKNEILPDFGITELPLTDNQLYQACCFARPYLY